jgi:hypothetical protein
VEQLIVGVLLFTPLLGLLPTTTAWYISACALHACLACLRLLLLGVGSWLQLRPLHVLAARWRQPLLFPGQLMLLPCSLVGATPTTVTTVTSESAASASAATMDPAAADAGGGGGGASVKTSSIGRRRGPDTAGSSRHEQQDGAGPTNSADAGLAVSAFHVFYEPSGYWEVLVQSIAQQQGLLWHACQGPSSSSGESSWLWVRRFVSDLAVGKVWGLRLLSSQWRQL